MPRKIVKRLLQYASSQALPRSLERNLTVKVFVAKKFHTSNQGVLFNQKLSGAQEYKRGKPQVPPILSEKARFSFSTFATLPVQHREASARTQRTKLRVRGLPSKANAPTFAAEPIWQRRFYDAVADYNETQRRKLMTRTKERLEANPLWRYSQMDSRSGVRRKHPSPRPEIDRQKERGAMRWLGTLERGSFKGGGVHAPKSENRREPSLSIRSALKAFAQLELSAEASSSAERRV